jgi:glycosyltransferase involved in cell wall biosynthesis
LTAAAEPSRLPLSVLIRTLNEGDRIARTLRSVAPLGAELVVIDAGSKDDTAAIARSLGAVVYENPWPGFGPQRHFGEAKCSNDMIFSLDADEAATEALVAEIKRAFAAGPATLMIVRKASVFPGYDKPWPLSFCHEQILIYDRRVARTGPNPNWDKLEITTKDAPVRLSNPLWHYSTRNLNHAVTKAVYVGQLAADTQPVRSSAGLTLRLIVEFPIAFCRYYFARRFFLAGGDGFAYAIVGAYSRWIRIALMRERARREGK